MKIVGAETRVGSEPYGLWGRAFRPFFLGLAVHTALVVPWWTFVWLGPLSAPAWLSPIVWHGHEMVFGLAAAAIAGFLLTASPVWSGGPALTGRPLAALFGLWVLGRAAFAAASWLPAGLVAAVDVAFLPAVAGAAIRTLRGSGQTRNQALVGLVLALALANAAVHAEAIGVAGGLASPTAWIRRVSGLASPVLRFAVDTLVVLVLVIGGRITPAFTRNALQRRGVARPVRSVPAVGACAIGAAVALALVTPVAGRTPWTGMLATLAGLAALARLAGWQTWATRHDPLLWSLHAGAAWVGVGLLLVGAGDLGLAVPASAGLHALTVGAIGTTILAVITRVGLGHTGRPLVLPKGAVVGYGLVQVAALGRVAAPFASGAGYRAALLISGLAWAAAFALFAVQYGPILTRPRPDGRPG